MLKNLIIVVALMLTAIISMKTDETNCFPPCADAQTTHEQYSSEVCPGCYMEIYYDVSVAINCVPEKSYIAITKVAVPATCIGVGKCFLTYQDAIYAAMDEIYLNVIQYLPFDVIKIELKECWSAYTITGPFVSLTPCLETFGCCEYTLNKIDNVFEIIPSSVICEDECFSACGWHPKFFPWGNILEKKSLNESINSLIISPNPAQNEITIVNKDSEFKFNAISISDINGKVLISQDNISNSSLTIDTRKLNNGTYFINIYDSGNLVYTKNIIIQK